MFYTNATMFCAQNQRIFFSELLQIILQICSIKVVQITQSAPRSLKTLLTDILLEKTLPI